MSSGKLALAVAITAGCAGAGPTASEPGPPPPQDMEATRSLGLWRSNFGAVKLEPDSSHGGLQAGAVHGVWQYDRQGQEVIGYFFGTLRGNVLSFRWQEPASPPLVGDGFLVFDLAGRQFSGRWWNDGKDRVGVWNGWRPPMPPSGPSSAPPSRQDIDPFELEPTTPRPPAQPAAPPPPPAQSPPPQSPRYD